MANPKLTKAFVAEAAVLPFRIVKIGATDGSVLQSTAVSEVLLGVADEIGQATIAGRVDVIMEGIADVTYGATVTRGARLTTDATGRAVAAAPGTGTNNGIIGIALVSGVVGDVGSVQIAPCIMQG
jgi:hypothetical protein